MRLRPYHQPFSPEQRNGLEFADALEVKFKDESSRVAQQLNSVEAQQSFGDWGFFSDEAGKYDGTPSSSMQNLVYTIALGAHAAHGVVGGVEESIRTILNKVRNKSRGPLTVDEIELINRVGGDPEMASVSRSISQLGEKDVHLAAFLLDLNFDDIPEYSTDSKKSVGFLDYVTRRDRLGGLIYYISRYLPAVYNQYLAELTADPELINESKLELYESMHKFNSHERRWFIHSLGYDPEDLIKTSPIIDVFETWDRDGEDLDGMEIYMAAFKKFSQDGLSDGRVFSQYLEGNAGRERYMKWLGDSKRSRGIWLIDTAHRLVSNYSKEELLHFIQQLNIDRGDIRKRGGEFGIAMEYLLALEMRGQLDRTKVAQLGSLSVKPIGKDAGEVGNFEVAPLGKWNSFLISQIGKRTLYLEEREILSSKLAFNLPLVRSKDPWQRLGEFSADAQGNNTLNRIIPVFNEAFRISSDHVESYLKVWEQYQQDSENLVRSFIPVSPAPFPFGENLNRFVEGFANVLRENDPKNDTLNAIFQYRIGQLEQMGEKAEKDGITHANLQTVIMLIKQLKLTPWLSRPLMELFKQNLASDNQTDPAEIDRFLSRYSGWV